MAALDSMQQLIGTQAHNNVYGTFNKQFDPIEFEREREDGTTIMDLTPDCRVFIGGAEVTHDVEGVTVNHTMDGGNCSITLTNPRGKYEITKIDLMKKWREDKDVLATYDYSYLKRLDPLSTDKLAQKIGGAILGAGGEALVGKSMDLVKQGMSTLNSVLTAPPKIRPVTRMLFETKFYSGISRKTGDIVFDYKDPVIVFMKGRFSPYWYFVFTGIVVSYSDSDAYGENNTLTLTCEDPTTIWKRSKMTLQAAFYGMSNLENSVLNTSKKTVSNVMNDLQANFTFSNLLKVVCFTYDYGLKTKNLHPTAFVTEGDTKLSKVGDKQEYDRMFSKMKDEASIHDDMKVTDPGLLNILLGKAANVLSSEKQGVGVVNVSDLSWLNIGCNLNNDALGPAAPLYFQLQLMEFWKDDFTGKSINKALDLTVRMWERDHEVNKYYNQNSLTGTGWLNKQAFGICGINPAMKVGFIDNFNILENIWSQYYVQGSVTLEKCPMTLYDRVYETVVGSPTEYSSSSEADPSVTGIPNGTSYNIFRPRLFIVLPQKYANSRKGGGSFGNVAQISQDSATTIFEYLKKTLKPIEYNFYATPTGDVIIEPDLYDFHPLEFSDQIEPRSIIKSTERIEFRGTKIETPAASESSESSSNQGSVPTLQPENTTPAGRSIPIKIKQKAYSFDPKANHPFFIMEKDRIRNTYTFSADKIVSAVSVQGAMGSVGGPAELQPDESLNSFSTAAARASGEAITTANKFVTGVYVANGFDQLTNNAERGLQLKEAQKDINLCYQLYKQIVFIKLISEKYDTTIGDLIVNFITGVVNLYEDNSELRLVWNKEIVQDIINYLSSRSYTTDPAVKSDNQTKQYVVIKYLSNLLRSENVSGLPGYTIINEKILSKKVSYFLKIDLTPTATAGQQDTRNSNKAFLEASKTKAVNTESPTVLDAKRKLIQEYTDNGLFNFGGNEEKKPTLLGIKRSIVNDLFLLFEPDVIKGQTPDSEAQRNLSLMEKLLVANKLPRQLAATTLADLKQMQRDGLYDPRTDLVRLYGFKKMTPMTNMYIQQGIEATLYAKAIFNRLLGDSRSIQITMVGRPEMQLNRPYYFERKDCIGTAKSYTLSYRYGNEFNSTVILTYIRNNALTYEYSLGPDLDVIAGTAGAAGMTNDTGMSSDSRGNAYFAAEGRMFLQAQEMMKKQNQLLGQKVSGVVSKKTDSVTGKAIGTGVTSLLGSIQVGGLYSAHDFLGHMNYDERGQEATITVDDKSTGDLTELMLAKQADTLASLARQITTALSRRTALTTEKTKQEALLKDAKEKEKSAKDEATKKKDKQKSAKPTERNSIQAEFNLLDVKAKVRKDELDGINKKINLIINQIETVNKTLYGKFMVLRYFPRPVINNPTNLTSYARVAANDPKIVEDQLGLFVQLFINHFRYVPNSNINKLSISETDVGFDINGKKQSFAYYISTSK